MALGDTVGHWVTLGDTVIPWQVVTGLQWAQGDPTGVPVWVVVLSVLLGLLLLALLCYGLYKLGFFKRSGPYGTAMEKAQLKPQAASEA